MLPEMMKAVIAHQPGGPEVLTMIDRAVPQPGGGEVLIRVSHAGVNRPDIMQRSGMPVPPGTSEVLGLEVSGVVAELGEGVDSLNLGTPVMALLNGGGYAEYCVARAELCLPVPGALPLALAAGVPEA
ncbi:MAG TPA: NAD(P)H-quinone oxidoreductase, partial [Pantoea sp.]|nr:NAD(P)H-quinone oxidoreductase [Pantoea sp.]